MGLVLVWPWAGCWHADSVGKDRDYFRGKFWGVRVSALTNSASRTVRTFLSLAIGRDGDVTADSTSDWASWLSEFHHPTRPRSR